MRDETRQRQFPAERFGPMLHCENEFRLRTQFCFTRRQNNVTQDINVLALVKGGERYIFLYNDSRKADTLRTLGRFASNPELNFSWYDAAALSQKVRKTAQEHEGQSERFQLPKSN